MIDNLSDVTVTVTPPCRCGQPRRPGQHNCKACNAAAQRKHYRKLQRQAATLNRSLGARLRSHALDRLARAWHDLST